MAQPKCYRRGHERDRITYMKKVEEHFQNNENMLIKFRRMLRDFYEEKMNVFEASLRMACLLKTCPRLQEAFSMFLPRGYEIGLGLREHVYLRVPATTELTQLNQVDLKQNYVTLIPINHARYLTGASGIQHLKCNIHPSAPFRSDMMCTSCFNKRYLRRNFEDMKKFICYLKSEADQPEMFDTFLRNLKELHSGKLSLQQLFHKTARLLMRRCDLFYEFYSFVVHRVGIFLDERVKDYVDSLIPVPIDTVEVVIGADSVASDEDQVVVQEMNVTTDPEPRRSARLRNMSNETRKDQQIKPQAATRTTPINKTFPYTCVGQQNRRSVRLRQKMINQAREKSEENFISWFNQQQSKNSKTKKNDPSNKKLNLLAEGVIETKQMLKKSAPLRNSLQHETENSPGNNLVTQPQRNVILTRSKKPISSTKNLQSTKQMSTTIKKKPTSSRSRPTIVQSRSSKSRCPDKQKSSSSRYRPANQQASSTRSLRSNDERSRSTVKPRFVNKQSCSTRGRRTLNQESSSAKGPRTANQQSCSTRNRRPDKQQSNTTRGHRSVSQRPTTTRRGRSKRGDRSIAQQISTRDQRSVGQRSSSSIKRSLSNSLLLTNSPSTSEQPLNFYRFNDSFCQQFRTNRIRRVVRQSNFRTCDFVNKLPRCSKRSFRSLSHEPTNSTTLFSASPEPPNSRFHRSMSLEPASSTRPRSVSPETTSSKIFHRSLSLEPTSSTRVRSVSPGPPNSRFLRSMSLEPISSTRSREFASSEPFTSTRHGRSEKQ